MRRPGSWYLTFQATLNGGCNVQGLCGAGSVTALAWLKLDVRLQARAVQVREIKNCVTNQDLVRWTGQRPDQDLTGQDLKLRGGVLETTSSTPDSTAKTETVSTVRYAHAAPEQGLRVYSRQVAQK